MSAADASSRITLAKQAVDHALLWVAKARRVSFGKLDAQVHRLAFGYEESDVAVALGHVHDAISSQAKAYGEGRAYQICAVNFVEVGQNIDRSV